MSATGREEGHLAQLHARAFVRKPFDLDALLSLIAQAFDDER